MDEVLGFIVGCVLMLVVMIGSANILMAKSCQAQWRDSGLEHRYSLMGGCQLKNKAGQWIPADAYREVAP